MAWPLWRWLVSVQSTASTYGQSIGHLQTVRNGHLRNQRLHLRHIARLLAAPFSTMARALNRFGLSRL
jgi:hypothetical protein